MSKPTIDDIIKSLTSPYTEDRVRDRDFWIVWYLRRLRDWMAEVEALERDFFEGGGGPSESDMRVGQNGS